MRIHINDSYLGQRNVTVDEWVEEAPTKLNLEERVPGVVGEAIDFVDWYSGWRRREGAAAEIWPSHLRLTAADDFTVLIPWAQLDQAALLCSVQGKSLTKGYPVRLYVPDGSSECLNVKSIVQVEMLYEPELGNEASYGFKTFIKMDEMKLKKGV